jgi:hypothetical protein
VWVGVGYKNVCEMCVKGRGLLANICPRVKQAPKG